MSVKNEMGLRIKELRKKQKKSQYDVAEHIGINRVSVSQWESQGDGVTKPKGEFLIALSEFLNTTPQYLLRGVIGDTIGNRIKILRTEKGINQRQLAEKLGIEPPSVNQWESGKTIPSAKSLTELCNILNTTGKYILYGADNGEVLGNISEKISEVDEFKFLKDACHYLDGCSVKERKRIISFIISKYPGDLSDE
jgi:transcriptional regulator with XRE-family HTH domain